MLRVLWLLILISATVLGILGVQAENKPYRLIIGFDGVSYGLMTELYDGGYFREFQRPTPLLATFPSISDPNWTLIMGVPPEDSYTKAHFHMIQHDDGSLGKEVGTVINHLTIPPNYEKIFNFKPIGVIQHLMTVTWSQTSALYWIESLSKKLLTEKLPHKHYTALIINTDIISHVSGKKALMEYFKKIEKRLSHLRKDFKKEHGRELEIVFVSDHGAYYNNPISVDFEKPLKAAGWKWSKTLRNSKDYAFVAPEIISFAAFYTRPKEECDLALLMSHIKGVQTSLCSPQKDKIQFFSKNGRVEISIDTHKRTLSYQLLSGEDPFGHDVFFKKARTLTWQEYFDLSFDTNYPYAYVRGWEGFYIAVKNPASVLVSPEKGYVFTNLTLEILTALSGIKSTHGSFEKEESLGLVMTTSKSKEEVFTPSSFYNQYVK